MLFAALGLVLIFSTTSWAILVGIVGTTVARAIYFHRPVVSKLIILPICVAGILFLYLVGWLRWESNAAALTAGRILTASYFLIHLSGGFSDVAPRLPMIGSLLFWTERCLTLEARILGDSTWSLRFRWKSPLTNRERWNLVTGMLLTVTESLLLLAAEIVRLDESRGSLRPDNRWLDPVRSRRPAWLGEFLFGTPLVALLLWEALRRMS